MTFDLVRQLVDRLSATEQAQLLAHLAPKLANAVAAQDPPLPPKVTTWDDFFAAGESLQEDDSADGSMTQAVVSMRR
jgi:hypothetical protein